MYNFLSSLVFSMWFRRGCLCCLYSVNIYPKKEKDEKANATTISFLLDYFIIHVSENEIENNAPIKTIDGWMDG